MEMVDVPIGAGINTIGIRRPLAVAAPVEPDHHDDHDHAHAGDH